MQLLLKSTLILSFLCFSLFSAAQQFSMEQVNGMTPRNIGPAGMSGRVTTIEVNPRDMDEIYIGTAAGGIFKSENSGHTWNSIFDTPLAASIGAIALAPKNPNIVYVGTGEGNPRNSQNSGRGMFKSLDGGRTWTHLGLKETRQIHRVIIHPDDPNTVVIGVSGATWGESEHRGIYKTTDGGKTWRKVLYIDQQTGCSDLVVDPKNPNKLIAGMWAHQRTAWSFQSGGSQSGLFLSNDGGETWSALSDKDGLPKGDIGRIGLSFAPSNPKIVYAYIEAKENGIYRSNDGGFSWSRVSRPKQPIGGRPFYYADIYVDVTNENRIYSIATTVNVSDDGGQSWKVFAAGNKIHTDHHAWWAHPSDPNFLMVGHDGGLNITHDRGQNWWFADNLPLGQFYHIRVDNEIPYNVYGGLQDNGSWIGPSSVRFKGGIRNLYWQRLSVGDGFDVVPDPLNTNFGYAMGQAGNLVRYNRQSGQLTKIKPVHPEGTYLRFNWNTGIAIDPFDQKTIYYGSQYLLKSSDQGQNWQVISPDLTTNHPDKTNYLETGGLTYDVTGAENHCTIITIAPSTKKEGLIWVGTDDGKVQLTRDGGKSWSDLTDRFQGVPKNTWVPQIQASRHNPAEAFVVFDDHRRNNWSPFVFHTKDYGKTWKRIVSEKEVDGYIYCIEQDPQVPNLLFCGSEFGLYISFDYGQNWDKWTKGLPTMPISDLVVHPRDHDLVIGTFGRSIWILDDIGPLRSIAQGAIDNLPNRGVKLFPVSDAYLNIIGESIGYRYGKIGDALFEGTNRPYGALISFYMNPQNAKPSKMAKVAIHNASGELVKTMETKVKPGINRFSWNLSRNGVRFPSQSIPKKNNLPPSGKAVPPGTYTLYLSIEEAMDSISFTVLKDPLLPISEAQIAEKETLIQSFYKIAGRATAVMDEIRAIEVDLGLIKSKLKYHPDEVQEVLTKSINSLQKELDKFKITISGKSVQGIYRDPNAINSQLFQTNYLLDHVLSPASPNQNLQLGFAKKSCEQLESSFALFKKDIQQLKSLLKTHNISWLD